MQHGLPAWKSPRRHLKAGASSSASWPQDQAIEPAESPRSRLAWLTKGASAAAGLSPEFVSFAGGAMQKGSAMYNILRPETVESIFMLWRVTGDPIYRDWGFEIFKAFENYSKVCTTASLAHEMLGCDLQCCMLATSHTAPCRRT